MASVKVVRLLSQLATKELVSQVAQVPKEVTQVQRRIFLRQQNRYYLTPLTSLCEVSQCWEKAVD